MNIIINWRTIKKTMKNNLGINEKELQESRDDLFNFSESLEYKKICNKLSNEKINKKLL